MYHNALFAEPISGLYDEKRTFMFDLSIQSGKLYGNLCVRYTCSPFQIPIMDIQGLLR